MFCTVSSAAQKNMQDIQFDFDTVIIDDATVSKEIETLIALRYGSKRIILVGGTPKQHQPKAELNQTSKYFRSLFERL